MLVLNENDQLQSLLAKAQRGEITLVAQPCGDGNYILQESIENDHQQQSSSEYIATSSARLPFGPATLFVTQTSTRRFGIIAAKLG